MHFLTGVQPIPHIYIHSSGCMSHTILALCESVWDQKNAGLGMRNRCSATLFEAPIFHSCCRIINVDGVATLAVKTSEGASKIIQPHLSPVQISWS